MNTLDRTLLIVNAKGWRLHLDENSGGKHHWSAMAVGPDRELQPSGESMYMREIAFGATYDEAMQGLIDKIALRDKPAAPKKRSVEDIFG